MTTTQVSAADQQPRNIVHKASDKRRAQNRAAQKTYREKRKKRLQELEELAAGVKLSQTGSPTHEQDSPSDQSSGDQEFDSPASFPFLSTTELPISATYDDLQCQTGLSKPFQFIEPQVYGVDTTIDDSLHDNDNNHGLIWQEMGTIGSAFAEPVPSYKSASDLSTTSTQGCLDISSSTSVTSVSAPTTDEVAIRNPAYMQADPSINHIWLQTTAIYSACFQNMLHIGIMVEDPCMDELTSLFYASQIETSSNPDTLVKIIQNNYADLKPDLRPTKTQITRKHPAYLDVLPFPDLRDRLIELTTHDPPLLDEEEFLRDATSGGVVCWGSSGGVGQSPAGGGAPWDSRSWEAKTWFLNKWNWLIGEESDLARNSAWWRTMRGHQQGISF